MMCGSSEYEYWGILQLIEFILVEARLKLKERSLPQLQEMLVSCSARESTSSVHNNNLTSESDFYWHRFHIRKVGILSNNKRWVIKCCAEFKERFGVTNVNVKYSRYCNEKHFEYIVNLFKVFNCLLSSYPMDTLKNVNYAIIRNTNCHSLS